MNKLKILLVEDSSEKASAICNIANLVLGLNPGDLMVVPDVIGAKRELGSHRYDVLILDIQVPMRFGETARIDGGVRLIDELNANTRLHKPSHIVGVTQFEESFLSAAQLFNKSLTGLILYSQSSNTWKDELRSFLIQVQSVTQAGEEQVGEPRLDLVIVCALNDPELRALISLESEFEAIDDPDGCMIGYRVKLDTPRGTKKILAACALEMGMAATAALSAKLIERYRPRYIAMCGIAGGVKGEVQLGDIIVADVVWDYSSGKLSTDINGAPVFKPEPKVITLDAFTKRQIMMYMSDSEVTRNIQNSWKEKLPTSKLSVHLGPMFTGALVVSNQAKVDELTHTHRKVKGIEMEAYAVFCAAKYSDSPQPVALAIKAISDLADHEKDDVWQRYAAHTSASYLLEWARRYL
jgi:nucleoside phosphorylase/CheY-like chemotaxis protein